MICILISVHIFGAKLFFKQKEHSELCVYHTYTRDNFYKNNFIRMLINISDMFT